VQLDDYWSLYCECAIFCNWSVCNFYAIFVNSTVCWVVKSQHENQASVAEMRVLLWMSGKTRHYREREWG
jgi:hypothetical protein